MDEPESFEDLLRDLAVGPASTESHLPEGFDLEVERMPARRHNPTIDQQHRSAGRQPRPPKFPPHRRSKRRSVAFRHTEVPLFDTPQFLDRLSFQLRQAQ